MQKNYGSNKCSLSPFRKNTSLNNNKKKKRGNLIDKN